MSAPTVAPRRWAILVVMCLALVLTGLDTLIVTMALPSIRIQLDVTADRLQWVVDAYSLAFAAPILFAGALADRFGPRRIFLTGMAVFLVGSGTAVVAGSAAELIAARVAMGLGAALIMPSTLSLVRHVFPPEERAKAMGIWVGVASLGVPLGPLVGGLLLENFWWGSVFLINVPVVALAIVGCLVLVPDVRNADRAGLDVRGLALSVVGSLLLVDGIIEAPGHGWTSLRTLFVIVAGASCVVAFLRWERRAPRPMLSSAVFRDRLFGGPLVTIASVFFGVFGVLFLVTQYLQLTLGLHPLAAGLHMLPMCTAVVIAPVAPQLVQRFGLGPVSMLGPLLVAAAMAVLLIGESPSSLRVMIALGLLGAGIGFGAPTSVDAIMTATPTEESGAGSAVADVAMQLGGGLGIAIMGSLATTAETGGMAVALTVGAAVAVGGAMTVLAILPRGRATVPTIRLNRLEVS